MSIADSVAKLNATLTQRGLTAQQAQQQYGLPPSSTDWMKNVGVKFSATPGQPSVAVSGDLQPASLYSAPNIVAPQGAASQTVAPQVVQAPNVTAGLATAGSYQATDAKAALRDPAVTWTPDAASTVEGRIAGITAKGSPLQQQAKTRALQEQNARGTLNSSMALQAGEMALWNAALPIAQQDANTFAQAGQFNAAAENERQGQNAQLGTQVALTNADARNQAGRFNAEMATQVSQFNVDEALKAGVINQEQANRMAQFNAATIAEMSKFNAASINDMVKVNLDNALKAGAINQQQYNEMARFASEQSGKMAMFELQTDTDVAKFNASESNALQKLGIDSATKLELANIEATYKTLMQSSASASEIYKSLLGQIATVLTNKDMNEQAKRDAIGNLTGVMNASLDVVGEIGNLSLPELTFNDGRTAPSTSPSAVGDAPVTPPPAPAPTTPTAAPGTVSPSNPYGLTQPLYEAV